MKQFSNKYMLLYALGLAAMVALVLTIVATSLKPIQDKNRDAETKQMILKTIGIEATRDNAAELYTTYIIEKTNEKGLPYYVFSPRGKGLYRYGGVIIPLKGNGLWGPIWGYIALADDSFSTVVGAVFDHQSETPGLGAEIATDKFAKRFIGKRMDLYPIKLTKNADKDSFYQVDAISGGTMTSNGVSDMLEKAFNDYSDIVEWFLI